MSRVDPKAKEKQISNKEECIIHYCPQQIVCCVQRNAIIKQIDSQSTVYNDERVKCKISQDPKLVSPVQRALGDLDDERSVGERHSFQVLSILDERVK